MNKEQLIVINQIIQSLDGIEAKKQYITNLNFEIDLNNFFIDTRDYNIYSIVQIG